MGLAAAAAVAPGGLSVAVTPATPAAVVATEPCPNPADCHGRLGDLPALVAEAGDGPALMVIGEVVAAAIRGGPSIPCPRRSPHDRPQPQKLKITGP